MNELVVEAQRLEQDQRQRSIDTTDSASTSAGPSRFVIFFYFFFAFFPFFPNTYLLKVEVMDIDQEELERVTEPLPTKSTKPRTRKASGKRKNAAATKRAIKKEAVSSDEFSSAEPDQRDMDPDYDPEVTMAMMGPPREASNDEVIAGPRTRNRSRSNAAAGSKRKLID